MTPDLVITVRAAAASGRGDAQLSQWARLIESEYREMPGLSLTETQIRRLWQLDSASTTQLIRTLIASGFLHRTARGTYVRGRTAR